MNSWLFALPTSSEVPYELLALVSICFNMKVKSIFFLNLYFRHSGFL